MSGIISDFDKMSVKELQQFAKDHGLKGFTALKKQELISFIVTKAQEAQQAGKAKAAAGNAGEKDKETREKVYEGRGSVQNTASGPQKTTDDSNAGDTGDGGFSWNVSSGKKYDDRKTFDREPAESRIVRRESDITEAYENDSQERELTKEEKEAIRQERRAVEAAAVEARIEEIERSAPVIDPNDKETYAKGIMEVMADGFGFIRSDNFLTGEEDVYVQNIFIKKYNLRNGDVIEGLKKRNRPEDKFMALVYLVRVNGNPPAMAMNRPKFENLTPIYPDERIRLERPGGPVANRIIDLISPIGKGQRGMIVSQPKAGKTTLLKSVANAITKNYPRMHIIILLIDERPEEVTDIKESIMGDNVDVIYSTFDEQPEHHKKVSEMVVEHAKRRVEMGQDVIILLDSITRLARAYNLIIQPSGRTLSGGLDPAALYMPKRFFGAARNMREGGSLTILATALVDTGSKMDDVVFEEFKGTGNMEIILDRKVSERRIFPAIDLAKSGTRRDDLLLNEKEVKAMDVMHKALSGMRTEEAAERIIDLFYKTKNNDDLAAIVSKKNMV